MLFFGHLKVFLGGLMLSLSLRQNRHQFQSVDQFFLPEHDFDQVTVSLGHF